MNPLKITPLDLSRIRTHPLADRASLTHCEDILLSPESIPAELSVALAGQLKEAVRAVLAARELGASVMLVYGAHLLRNGAALILEALMNRGWITHVATNGAGTIHDWEYAWLGKSTEGVEANVATGTFGCWDETSANIHLAVLAGALDGLGYGAALGRFISEDGVTLPSPEVLRVKIAEEPEDRLTAVRADLLRFMRERGLTAGRVEVVHQWKHASILASAWKHGVSASVHPGIGYDIITNHPCFNGGAIGRAGAWDFALFSGSVERLEGGVVLSVGSAIMAPQVFEKSLSCVNNVRLQSGLGPLSGHSIFVVDLQDGGGWDWTEGEPPKTNAAYYLRFCKSFSRMGAPMHYLQCDNVAFIHHLWHALSKA